MKVVYEVTGAFNCHRFFSTPELARKWIDGVVRALGFSADVDREFVIKTHEVDGS